LLRQMGDSSIIPVGGEDTGLEVRWKVPWGVARNRGILWERRRPRRLLLRILVKCRRGRRRSQRPASEPDGGNQPPKAMPRYPATQSRGHDTPAVSRPQQIFMRIVKNFVDIQ